MLDNWYRFKILISCLFHKVFELLAVLSASSLKAINDYIENLVGDASQIESYDAEIIMNIGWECDNLAE